MESACFTTGAEYSLGQFCEMHNVSFAGYFAPMNMTPAAMASFIRIQQIDLYRCVVMHTADGAFAGLAKLALRGRRAWCGGFGIALEMRGTGQGKLLVQQMIVSAREAEATLLQLEVLAQNAAAIRLYEGAGFQRTGRMVGIELEADALPVMEARGTIAAVAPEMLLPWLSVLPRPVWQREISSMFSHAVTAQIFTGMNGAASAIISHRSPERIMIDAVLLHPRATAADVAVLLRVALAGDDAPPLIQLYNEPEGSRALALFRELGFREFFSQYAMELRLG